VNVSSLGISLPDRYRMEGPVASGGMAAVYAAHDTLLDRPVAVKVLAEHLNEDVAARERFQREARAAASLSSHPGVVTIFDVGEHAGRSFIVMELFGGGTLSDVLRSGERPPPAKSLAWLQRAAEALDVAHERGIVHRDIKPANLLLDDRGNLAVADFGIARLAWEDAVTQTGQVLGTAAYISPEQAEGGTATAASDRYALACVAYELITGARPFDGEHFAAQARAHIEDEPTPPTQRDPSLPAAVDRVLARGLAKNPDDRWPTAVAFVAALEQALDGPEPTAPVAAADPDVTRVMERSTLPAAAGGRFESPAPRRPAPAGPPRDRGMRLPLLLATGLLVAAIVALVVAAGGGGNDDPSSQRAADEPAAEKTAEPKAEEEKPAEPTPEPTKEPEPEQPAAAAKPEGSIDSLNNKGWALYQQGNYADGVPYFREAVAKCGDSGQITCQYALYNLGSSLHRSGNSAEGLPYLQDRLARFPENQPDVVRAEIADACAAAGQDCGGDAAAGGNGKAKGKKKKE
jgi:serine/threonine-protein kinase